MSNRLATLCWSSLVDSIISCLFLWSSTSTCWHTS